MEKFKVVIVMEMTHFHQKDRCLLMNSDTKLVFQLLEKMLAQSAQPILHVTPATFYNNLVCLLQILTRLLVS